MRVYWKLLRELSPGPLTVGPDRALWTSDSTGGKWPAAGAIARMTTRGEVTVFRSGRLRGPGAITSGPDGALWFVNRFADSIGRITTHGRMTLYTSSQVHNPQDIVAGPDGAMWFTNFGGKAR